jgi:transcription elongation factor GreA
LEVVYLTKAGLAKLEAELSEYQKVLRPQAAYNVEEARKHGDLFENAEYEVAREELTRIEKHIFKLQQILANVHIIDAEKIGVDSVRILNKITLKDLNSGKEFTYVLVSPEEVDLDKGHISVKSPVGKALLGKKAGDVVKFTVPAGEKQWKILHIGPPEA